MSQQTENELTETQRDVLDFIIEYKAAEERPPTIREIGSEFGWSSTNAVKCHLNALRTKGYIDWEDGKSRTIKVLKYE